MQTRITTPFSLKQYDIVHCSLQGIPYALIVSDPNDPLYHDSPLVYIVPGFPYSLVEKSIDLSISTRGVLVKGHKGNYHEINLPGGDDLWLATNLMRSVTKGRIVGHSRVASLRADLINPVREQLKTMLGF